MNDREQRLQDIIKIVQEHDSISVESLQDILGVSGSTVRSDLRILVKEGKIQREHGRVTRVSDIDLNDQDGLPSFEHRLQINLEQKERIAKIAESFINNNDSIILDASSTCFLLAKRLVNSGKNLTVVTNSVSSAQLLHKNQRLQVILIGGTLGVQNNTEGTLGISVFEHLNIKKCFVSGYGVSVQQGITDFSLLEIELKKKFVEVAQESYALVDSSKFDVVSVGTFCSLDKLDAIITDDELPNELTQKYQNKLTIIKP
ncbi:DeoR/GlpR family DNA-binding transcription regulator [Pullulanibacillus sp. KACC 23026]|uniref:DeoR/GlpR family DNA-binding transcription regulator n=1 Tax=Pullulanibacillus sp. KACC 23026 TaxID=3028315 RepID=UPI0023B08EE4|nr:DeoR/GlpR family DNA-binding transcription regulator [Pullulanibacillus sp. KACC 23026]WEG13322.1 DeoR/GlpR family DNA-binding transcription regulator [Pullulanibacillus sp. KACC 23026]